ncbi:hypothetical protein CK203_034577 [Vitis vinifera]|uniref:Uncharacterized protein n=1 Tax=Vitis vinifera TaxID=29760 RepID=A0A438IDW2_VITVI|nr:hypothetical protein CK203_034577 [Vitis vinifera]
MTSEGGSAMPGGDITRFKSHLMHKDSHNNTKKCPRVPPEVKEEIRLLVHDKQKAKAKKNVDIEDIRSQLRGTMGTHHTYLVNEDDDDEDAEDEDTYVSNNMHPDERDAYQSAVHALKASNWEREQHENIVGSRRKPGESSTGTPSTMRKSQSMQHSHHSPPIAPSFYKSSVARKKNIKDIFKGGAIKETMGRLIRKFFIYESVAPAKAKSHHFKNMIIGAQQAAYFLNPRFQYRRGVGSDPELLQAVHDVFAKLDLTTESLGQFGNELVLFRDAKRGFGDRATIAARSTMVPEVHSESFSKDTDDSLQAALNSHQEIDSTSVGHSSRPSTAGTFASGYDGSRGGTDDRGDNGGEDIDERRQSQYPINQFTCENDFTHCTQDEDHGSRRASPGIGAIGKPYRGRERMMEPYNEELLSGSFESMSIGTQFSDSSNKANVYPPHVMSYGQPSSLTDEEYSMSHYSLSRQMPYQVPY